MEIAYLNSQSTFQIINWDRFNSTLILEITRNGRVYTSSAVAIAPNLLITAAHSVDQICQGKALLGKKYKTTKKWINISRCIIHPEYNPSKSFFENDIAIVVLEERLPENIQFEKLASSILLNPGEVVDRIGFGQRNNQNIRTWTNPVYKSVTFDQKNYVLEDNLSVVGDSGGPIYKNNNGELQLIGIHSTLEGRNKTYVVNIARYKDWIEMNKNISII